MNLYNHPVNLHADNQQVSFTFTEEGSQ
jgi:hypothetical protein